MGRRSEARAIAGACGICLLAGAIAAWQPARSHGARPALEDVRRDADAVRSESGTRSSAVVPLPLTRLSAKTPPELESEDSAAPPLAGATLRGRVLHFDGSFAAKSEVWSLGAHAFTNLQGAFEISGATLDQPLHATLPGFQPAREIHPDASGNVLRLGPPALKLDGRIRSVDGRAGEGWRIALLDATLLEPLRGDAATLENVSSRGPRRLHAAADGTFSVDGLAERPYTPAAWRAARERIELHAAPPTMPGERPVEILVAPAGECRTIELRFVDAAALPLAHLRVGLPGAPAIASTDGRGRIVITGSLPERIALVVLKFPDDVVCPVVETRGSADVVLRFP